MTALINRETGQQATAEQYAAARERAIEIVNNPYASPEQIEWALNFPGVEYAFWETANERRWRQYA